MVIDLLKTNGITPEEINIGGGLGIAYENTDPEIDIRKAVSGLANHFKSKVKAAGLGEPRLVLEPGRSIVGRAGVTLYTVGVIKDIPGIEKYVVVDGGMGDNSRPILYDAKYEAVIANKAGQKRDDLVTIAGRYCESGDIVIRGGKLQNAAVGDIVVVFATGAYNYSMASNYNQVSKPAMVLVKDGKAKLMVKPQGYEDLTRNEI